MTAGLGKRGPNPVAAVNQAKRIATTLADHLKNELATKRNLDVLRAELKADMAALQNQLLTAQFAAFVGIILYITLRL